MIAKLVRGRSFRGVFNYILRDEAEAEIIGGSMSGITPRELAREVRASRRLRPDVKDPVYHVSLSLPVDKGTDVDGNPIILGRETVDSETWQKMGEQWLKEMGLDPDHHQVIMVRHHNADHDHLHIVANRISLEGKVWTGWKDRLRCQSACRAVEQTHGLRHTEGIRERQEARKRNPNWRPKKRAKITNGEWQQSRRTKRNPYKQTIMNHIAEVCRTDPPPTHRQFISALQERGITAIPSVATHADRISGYRFALGAYTYKGSTVGYPWGELQHQLTPPKTKGEYQDLRGYSRQVDAGSAYDAVRSLRSAIWETARKGGTLEEHLRKDGWTVRGNIISRGEGGEEHDLRDYAPMDTIRASLDRVQADKAEFRRRSREAWSRAQREKWQPKYKPFGNSRPEEIVYLAIVAPELVIIMLILALLIALLCGWGKQPRPSELWKTSNVHNIQARSALADLRQQLLGLSQPAAKGRPRSQKQEQKPEHHQERRKTAWGMSVEAVEDLAGGKVGAPPPRERRPAPDPAPQEIRKAEPKGDEPRKGELEYRPKGPEWLFPSDLWGPQHPDDQDGGEDPREDTLSDRGNCPQGIER